MEAVGQVRPGEFRVGVQRALPYRVSVRGVRGLEPVAEVGGDELLAVATNKNESGRNETCR